MGPDARKTVVADDEHHVPTDPRRNADLPSLLREVALELAAGR
jgi:hypothetical protein